MVKDNGKGTALGYIIVRKQWFDPGKAADGTYSWWTYVALVSEKIKELKGETKGERNEREKGIG